MDYTFIRCKCIITYKSENAYEYIWGILHSIVYFLDFTLCVNDIQCLHFMTNRPGIIHHGNVHMASWCLQSNEPTMHPHTQTHTITHLCLVTRRSAHQSSSVPNITISSSSPLSQSLHWKAFSPQPAAVLFSSSVRKCEQLHEQSIAFAWAIDSICIKFLFKRIWSHRFPFAYCCCHYVSVWCGTTLLRPLSTR